MRLLQILLLNIKNIKKLLTTKKIKIEWQNTLIY